MKSGDRVVFTQDIIQEINDDDGMPAHTIAKKGDEAIITEDIQSGWDFQVELCIGGNCIGVHSDEIKINNQ